ncbi:MAG: hypothetical protein NTW52_08270 [Planctomycetota bacterium]|nr:hypothetical protein [Planctomycetota bacterium]
MLVNTKAEAIGVCPICSFVFTTEYEPCDCFCEKAPKDVTELHATATVSTPKPDPWPLLIRGIARQRIASDIGVGDTIQRILSKMGGTQFEWVMKRLGIDCGCGSRQDWLNAAYRYELTIKDS